MNPKVQSHDIDQLMKEADELMLKINSDVIKEMKEEHRLQIEQRAQHLKQIKSDIQRKIENHEKPEIGSGAEGIHAAIEDMMKAITSLKSYLF